MCLLVDGILNQEWQSVGLRPTKLIKCGGKVFKIHALLSSERKFLVRGIKNAKYGKFVDTLKTKESD